MTLVQIRVKQYETQRGVSYTFLGTILIDLDPSYIVDYPLFVCPREICSLSISFWFKKVLNVQLNNSRKKYKLWKFIEITKKRKLWHHSEKRFDWMEKNLPATRGHSHRAICAQLADLNTLRARDSKVALRARSYILWIHLGLFFVIWYWSSNQFYNIVDVNYIFSKLVNFFFISNDGDSIYIRLYQL